MHQVVGKQPVTKAFYDNLGNNLGNESSGNESMTKNITRQKALRSNNDIEIGKVQTASHRT